MVARLKGVASAIALAMALTSATPGASAQSPAVVVELIGDRGSLDARKLEELVVLELGGDAARVSRIIVDVGAGRASVDMRIGGERREGAVAIAAGEPERALALFVGELARGAAGSATAAATAAATAGAATAGVAAATAGAATAGPAAAATAVAGAPAASASPPRETPSTSTSTFLSLLASIGGRVMTTDGALLLTPKLEIGARRDRVRLGVTARYAYASADDPLGTVRVHALAGGGAATYTVLRSGAFAVATGPRFEAGGFAAQGEGSNGTSRTVLTFDGSWEVELEAKVGPIALLGAVQAGTYFRGLQLQADERDVLHLSGPFIGFALGARY